MGGKGSGRPPSVNSILNKNRRPEQKTPIATDMFLPNQSGDHSAGRVSRTPENETDIVNKKYVDDAGLAAITNLDGGDSDETYIAVGMSPIDGGDST
ncbi:hypothetical protein LCGC14_2590050 [marine sediment metagenome]|uniref:Uncharacterized protein n=1 Tax=marine sediment metagenome TaxID=412755 RepID=A0A0F9CMZ6_9ZZZZ